MPTTFSIALPAIATMTRPAKVWEMPSVVMAGSSACTNQSDTNAAATLETASRVTASHSGQRGASVTFAGAASPAASAPTAGLRLIAAGSDNANTTSSTIDTKID